MAVEHKGRELEGGWSTVTVHVAGVGQLPPLMTYDYDRTIVGFHGTRAATADKLVNGEPFGESLNDDDWLGHGIYFWEYAPQQAWWWAERRHGKNAAVVGALIRLGRCFDLLDPNNTKLLKASHGELKKALQVVGEEMPRNANNHKYLDCAVFNYMFKRLEGSGFNVESARAVFVPANGGRQTRLWTRSGVFEGAHVQICVREPDNILGVWPVRRDGRHGKDS